MPREAREKVEIDDLVQTKYFAKMPGITAKKVEFNDLVQVKYFSKMPGKTVKKVKLDDLVRTSKYSFPFSHRQSSNTKSQKLKCKYQKKTKLVIKHNSPVKKGKSENDVSNDSSASCNHYPKSSNEKFTETRKLKCISRKKTKPLIKHNSPIKTDESETLVSIESSTSCSHLKSSNKKFTKALANDISHSEDFLLSSPNSFIEKFTKTPKLKCRSQKKTKPVIKHNVPIETDKSETAVSIESSASCSYLLKSSNMKFTKALTNDVSYYSEDSLQNSFDENMHEMTEEDVLEQLSILQTLNRKETELKTAILFEKLKQEEFITDDILLEKKIAELADEVQKRRKDLRLKETMCSEVQLMETIRRITLPRCVKNKGEVKEVYDFSDAERGLILGHLLKKEQLKRELSSEQQEIAKIEENCRKMKLAIASCADDSISEKMDTVVSDDYKELESLKAENQKRGDRVQLFAKLVRYLIKNIKNVHNLNDDLRSLASACEQIQHWNYEDLDELEDLCKKVNSTKI